MKIVSKSLVILMLMIIAINSALLKNKSKAFKTDEDNKIPSDQLNQELVNLNSLIFKYFSEDKVLSESLNKAYDKKNKEAITLIYLIRNKKGAVGPITLTSLLNILNNTPKLESLSLSYCHLDDLKAKQIVNAILNSNLKLKSLCLMGNNLTLSAAKEIIGLLKKVVTLKTLNLAKNEIDSKDLEELKKEFNGKLITT